jgi:hypothetical protein
LKRESVLERGQRDSGEIGDEDGFRPVGGDFLFDFNEIGD